MTTPDDFMEEARRVLDRAKERSESHTFCQVIDRANWFLPGYIATALHQAVMAERYRCACIVKDVGIDGVLILAPDMSRAPEQTMVRISQNMIWYIQKGLEYNAERRRQEDEILAKAEKIREERLSEERGT